jgi:hypothetical protein
MLPAAIVAMQMERTNGGTRGPSYVHRRGGRRSPPAPPSIAATPHPLGAAPAREVRMSLAPAGARPSLRAELDESTAGGTPEKAMDDGGAAS